MFGLAVVALALVSKATAHGGVLSYDIAGKNYQGWAPYNTPVGQSTIQRPWADYNPITVPTDAKLSCNDDGTSPTGQLTTTVAAGSPIKAYWNQVWPHEYGPMLTYLAKCPGTSCTGVASNTLKWFKIDEAGLLSGTVGAGKWGSGKMIDQNSTWTSTIPSTVPSGSYLIRFETIAIHSLPAQMYPECAQIDITGGGTRAPTAAELVSFPGGYSASDPGLTTDLYSNAAKTQTTYIIPGPPLYGSGATSPTTGAPAPTTSVGSVPPTSSTAAPVGTVAQYGQCGGSTYSGPTVCIAPYKCTVSNQYYSQCL